MQIEIKTISIKTVTMKMPKELSREALVTICKGIRKDSMACEGIPCVQCPFYCPTSYQQFTEEVNKDD